MRIPKKKTVTVRHYRGQEYIGERQYKLKTKFVEDLHQYLALTDRWVEVDGPSGMTCTLGKIKGRTGVPKADISMTWDLA
mgnify:FL=1